MRLALYVADYVREAEQRATHEGASFADIAVAFDIPPAALTQCLMLTADGAASDPPPTVAAADPTRKYRLSLDPLFMGWAHSRKASNEQAGVAYRTAPESPSPSPPPRTSASPRE